MVQVLVVDDEAALRDSLRRALVSAGHAVEECADLERALARLAAPAPLELLVTDIRLGTTSGLDLIAEARRLRPDLPILAITAFGSVEVAVEAMRRGAQDFLEKPFRVEILTARVERLLEPARLRGRLDRLERENEVLRDELQAELQDTELVGSSPAMQRLRDRIERVAPSAASVLIRGESGTGKELVARRLHRLSGRGSFVAFNCSAVSETLAESELFGHEKGAFTGADRRRLGRFELADGGTLFLDEVGDLSPAVQVKLLRVLQERSFERLGGSTPLRVDVRILAATNRDLEAALREGRWREDLHYRLNVVTIDVPPLRAHAEDILSLAQLFLARYGPAAGRPPLRLSDDVLQALCAHTWPGNVRELENVIHRGAILCRDGVIQAEDIELELRPSAEAADAPATTEAAESELHPQAAEADSRLDLRSNLARVERELIERATREAGGNLSAAGRALGVDRNLLRYKLRKHGLRG